MIAPVRRLFRIVNGATPHSDEPRYWDGDIPWATPDDLGKAQNHWITETGRYITEDGLANCGASLAPSNSLVLSIRAPIGYVAIAGWKICTNQGCKSLVPITHMDTRYFYYQMVAAADELKSYGAGSTFQELSSSSLASISFALPSTVEQRVIADFLDHETARIDALIEEQQRLIDLLQEKRRAVISHAVTKGIDPDAPMKNSGFDWLGEVPTNWAAIKLKFAISRIESGTSVNASDVPASAGRYGVLKTSCVYNGWFDWRENKVVAQEEEGRVSCPLRRNTLIVSRMNTPDLVGSAGLVEEKREGIFLPDRLWQISFTEAHIPRFVYYFTLTSIYREQIRVACSGTSSSMQNLGQDDLREVIYPKPPTEEQERIVEFIDSEIVGLDSMIEQARVGVALLEERRYALISAAVTGKIDVRGWKPQNAPVEHELPQAAETEAPYG